MILEHIAQWFHYRRNLRAAVEHLNEAQRYHRDLFGKENEDLLAAMLAVSIESEKVNESKKSHQ